MKVLLFVAFLAFSFAKLTPEASNDLITHLPGLNVSVNFKQYAGYLTVDAAHGRKLFYWFVESQGNPSKDPVVLWLNGGPGCSSLIGFLSENGPFRPSDDGSSLKIDQYSWNQVANMLYLEAPAGVGFSYSNDANDYNTGDNRTATDNYHALQLWFKRYPHFVNQDFYISGESYGGHYVPTLANAVLEGNKNPNNLHINIKGILVGNGLTDNDIDLNAFIQVYGYHNLIPISLYDEIISVCDGNYIVNSDPTCSNLVTQSVSYLNNLDAYDVYAPICTSSNNHGYQPIQFDHPLKQFPVGPKFDPCIDLHLTDYLNRDDVRKAIHADDAAGTWTECSNNLNYNFSMTTGSSMIPLYKKFIAETNWRILIYSGDVDSILPTYGTQRWINTLNLSVTSQWRNWLSYNKQVGGYVQEYDGLTFLTIHGAGHMVPYFRPAHAYTFFTKFILNKPF